MLSKGYKPEKIVLASQVAKLDSNVHTGGGTDDTEALQAILDKVPELGGLTLIMDGAALVRGLKVFSDTTIVCLNASCGFYLADGANRPVLEGARRSVTEYVNRNITLLGGTYNQNCLHQQHEAPRPDLARQECEDYQDAFECDQQIEWVIGLRFHGVENLVVRDVHIRNQRTFAALISNFRQVHMENIVIELPDKLHAQNQDGLHFWGPGQFLTLRDISGCAGDDFIALAPDESDRVSSITDVLIDGVVLDDADQGIRLLSRDRGRLDRVTIRNVSGTYASYGFYINCWFPDGTFGNFGSITFENIDLRPIQPVYDYAPPFLFQIGGNIERLALRNVQWYPFDNRPLLRIGYPYYDLNYPIPEQGGPVIRSLLIDGLYALEQSGQNIDYITCRGKVESMTLRDIDLVRPQGEPGSALLRTEPGCEIGELALQRITLHNLESEIVNGGGHIGTVCRE